MNRRPSFRFLSAALLVLASSSAVRSGPPKAASPAAAAGPAAAAKPIDIVEYRYLKDDYGTYDDSVIEMAKALDANFILVPFTATSGVRLERWQRNLLPPFVEKAHASGMKVSFYMKLTSLNWKSMFSERPESRDWIMTYANGKPALYGGQADRYMGCLANPAWLEYLRQMIRDAVTYRPDALFYDNCFIPRSLKGEKEEGAASAWACYCAVCRVKFAAYTKQALGWECDLPVRPDWSDPVWQAFVRYRDETFAGALRMVVAYAHQLKPDIVVYPNVCPPWLGGGGAKGSATDRIAGDVDVLLFEKGAVPRAEAVPSGGMMRALCSAVDWKYGAALRDTPVWYRMNRPGAYSADQVRVALAEASAFNGATHHVMAAELSRNREKTEAIRRHYGFLQANRSYFAGARQVADVAIHVSTPTINWYYPDRATRGGSGLPMSIQGSAQALLDLHIPFNVVLDRDLERDHGYKAIVLPNVACMSDAQAEAVARFVENGGSVVATHLTSLYDETYRARKDFALAKVFGVHHGEKVKGLVKNRYGKGLSAYLAGPADEDYWRDGLVGTLDLFREAMAYALRDDWQIRVDAPATTVVNVAEAGPGRSTLVHLVNFEVSTEVERTPFVVPNLSFVKQVRGIAVTVRKPAGRSLAKVSLLSTDAEHLAVEEVKEGPESVSFVVPTLRIYDLVVVDWR